MNKIGSILRRFLNEAAAQNQVNRAEANYVSKINDAISKRYEVRFAYDDGTDNPATMERRVQIVAYGISKAGNPSIRAFQPSGGSKRGAPAWKLFRLDRIVPNTWRPVRNSKGSLVHFDCPPGPFTSNGQYNPDGDKGMLKCIKNADFTGAANKREMSYVSQSAAYRKRKEQQDLLQRNLKSIDNQKENPILSKNLENDTLAPEMQAYLKGGELPKARPLIKNNPASGDMSQVAKKQDFGLSKAGIQTMGPAVKGKKQATIPTTTTVDTKQAEQNGPVFKDSAENQENVDNTNKEENNENNG